MQPSSWQAWGEEDGGGRGGDGEAAAKGRGTAHPDSVSAGSTSQVEVQVHPTAAHVTNPGNVFGTSRIAAAAASVASSVVAAAAAAACVILASPISDDGKTLPLDTVMASGQGEAEARDIVADSGDGGAGKEGDHDAIEAAVGGLLGTWLAQAQKTATAEFVRGLGGAVDTRPVPKVRQNRRPPPT